MRKTIIVCLMSFILMSTIGCGKAEEPKNIKDYRETIAAFKDIISKQETGFYAKEYLNNPNDYSGETWKILNADPKYGELTVLEDAVNKSISAMYDKQNSSLLIIDTIKTGCEDIPTNNWKNAKPSIDCKIKWLKDKITQLEDTIKKDGY